MPFELPPLPNFNVNVPAMPSPLDQYGKMLQLKSLLGQQSLLPYQQQEAEQRVQAETLENQQRQLEMKSQQAMMKAWSDPDFLKNFTGTDKATSSGVGFDPDALTGSLISKGVLPKDAMAMTQGFIERSQKIAETQKAQAQTGEANAGIREKTLKQVGDALGAIQSKPVDKAQEALDAFKQKLVQDPKAFPGLTQDELAHLYAMDLGHMGAAGGLLQLEATMTDFHKSQAEKTAAEQKVINPVTGMSPEEQSIINKDVETRKQVQPLELSLARARAVMEQKLASAGNSELANVPTRMIPAATGAANKADQEFAAAKSVSDRMAATMEAARKGNVVSYQIIPQEGTLQLTTSQGVHRINKTEIEQYEGGGSLWQRLEGHIGKQLTGKSIPDSVLDDMADIQKLQEKGAQEKYHNALTSVNKRYGSTFSPVAMEDLNGQGGGGPAAPVDPFAAFGGKKR